MKEAKNLITRMLFKFADLIRAHSEEKIAISKTIDLYDFHEDEFYYQLYELKEFSLYILRVFKTEDKKAFIDLQFSKDKLLGKDDINLRK